MHGSSLGMLGDKEKVSQVAKPEGLLCRGVIAHNLPEITVEKVILEGIVIRAVQIVAVRIACEHLAGSRDKFRFIFRQVSVKGPAEVAHKIAVGAFLTASAEIIGRSGGIKEIGNPSQNVGHPVGSRCLDGIFIGPMDLSASMGIRGQFDNKEFKAAIKRIENIVIPSGKFLGTVANDIEDAQILYDKGYNIVYMMSDAVDLSRMAERTVVKFKEYNSKEGKVDD